MGLPRRERNLDFMDADTLAYYLGVDAQTGEPVFKTKQSPPPAPSVYNHNVAVMFYAQWDRNSHTLAPTWDRIGQITKAGTETANLILGLFDCEQNQQHLMLCHAAGITHYPTLMFMSPSRTFPHRPSLFLGSGTNKALPHTTTFQGIWQYEKSVLDWLRTMQRMSGWSAFWSKQRRRGSSSVGGWWQAASYDPSTANSLPVGIPVTSGGGGVGGSSTASSTSSSSSTNTAALQKLQKEKQQYEDLVLRSSILLDATLFPITEEETSSGDVFAFLHAFGGWNSTDPALQVIKTCTMEVALDYCTRLTNHKTNELVTAKMRESEQQQQSSTLAELEAELKTMIATAEPYCDIIETCIANDFETIEACRPSTCPFQKEAACHYLTSCFDSHVQQDYAQAMGLELSSSASNNKSTATSSSTAGTTTSNTKL